MEHGWINIIGNSMLILLDKCNHGFGPFRSWQSKKDLHCSCVMMCDDNWFPKAYFVTVGWVRMWDRMLTELINILESSVINQSINNTGTYYKDSLHKEFNEYTLSCETWCNGINGQLLNN